MYRRHGKKLVWVFLACDLVVTVVAWFTAYWVRFAIWPHQGIPNPLNVAHPLPAVLLFAALSYQFCGLYEIHRLQKLPREFGVLCQASLLLFGLVIAFTFYLRESYESRLALGMFLCINAGMLTVTRRAIWRVIAYARRHGLNYGRAIIVGHGRVGRVVAQTLLENHWTGLEPVGFVDEAPKVPSRLLPWLGPIESLSDIVIEQDADHVFVALPIARHGELPGIFQQISGLPVEMQLIPDIPNLAGMRIRMLEIDGVPFLSLREAPVAGILQTGKRWLDIGISLSMLLLLAPLFLLIAILVKWSSPGPILFRQPRAGLGGRKFNMLKFRTMRVDAEAHTGPIWTKPNDQRCTGVGRFLRCWSLDELPQLVNVLCGEMSLVGPRPERPMFIDQFRKELPSYPWRHQVKAGITGWAQVNGWRGNTSLRRRLEYDLYYINHWSLWLDLKILVLTFLRGFRHPNAY